MSLENMELLNDLIDKPYMCDECYERSEVIFECYFCKDVYCDKCWLQHWIPCAICNVKKSCTELKCSSCQRKSS
jgi:hypothetical protein